MGQRGDQVKITEIPNFLLPEANEHKGIDVDECISATTANVAMDIEADDNKLTELPVTSNADISMYSDENGSFTETTSVSHYADATKTASQVSPTANVSMNIDVDECAVEESESSYDDINTTQLPVVSTAKSQGRWHSAGEIYQLVVEAKEVVEDVPSGDKSNSYLLVNNERNMKRLSTGTTKKCDFFDDCGPGTTRREILLKRRMLLQTVLCNM